MRMPISDSPAPLAAQVACPDPALVSMDAELNTLITTTIVGACSG
jgi:hypothetical protein